MTDVVWNNSAETERIGREDWLSEVAYRFHILFLDEEGGGYSVVVLNLPPGIGSCGDTEEEAEANVREAILGALEEYAESGVEIPWRETKAEDIPAGAKHKWIRVIANA